MRCFFLFTWCSTLSFCSFLLRSIHRAEGAAAFNLFGSLRSGGIRKMCRAFPTRGFVFIFLSLFFFRPATLFADSSVNEAAQKRVLVLHSFHQGYQWTDSVHRGIVEGLAPESASLSIYTEYLDAARTPGEKESEAMRALLKQRYTERGVRFDAVLCADDDALLFLLKYRTELFGDVPVVFCGINNFTPDILDGRMNITGINEAISAAETIDVALKLRPRAKRLAVVSDSRLTGRRNLEIVKEAEPLFRSRVEFVRLEELEPDELAKRLGELAADDIVLYVSYLLTPSGRTFSPKESVDLVLAASPAPVFGCWDFLIPLGIAGGNVVHGQSQGEAAASLVRRILSGTAADDLPVLLESPNRFVFNASVLEKFGMPKEQLPSYSLVFEERKKGFMDEWERLSGKEDLLGYDVFRAHGAPMLLLDPESGMILEANQAALSFYGYPDLNGMNIWRIDTHTPEEVRTALSRARTLRRNLFRSRHVLADGSVRFVQVHAYPLTIHGIPVLFSMVIDETELVAAEAAVQQRNRWIVAGVLLALALQSLAIVLLARSTVRRKSAEREARKQLNFNRSLIDTMPNGVFYKDRDGRYLGCNAAYTELTGLRDEDIRGKSVADLWPREIAEAYLASDREIFVSSNVHRYQGRTAHIGGEERDVLFSKAPFFDENGAVAGLVGVITDITERKRFEEALLESNRKLEQSMAHARALAEKAEAANKAKSEFMTNMTHELLTPMNGVLGMTDLLLMDEALTEEQRQYAECIHSSGESLLGLINRILDISKAESGKIVLEARDFDLAVLLETFSHAMEHRADEKGLRFSTMIASGLPTALRGDSWRLRQVLFNLVDNAIKFTHRGEISLSVAAAETGDSWVLLRFSVRDTGIGIPHEKADILFRSFSQVDSSATRKYGGAGLGLALSRELAEMMGGEVGVDSAEGEGSEFWFTAVFERQATEGKDEAAGTELPFCARDARILLVEDNATNRRVVLGMLEKLHVEADAVADGVEALEALARTSYDLLLMDCLMPRMDGYETTRRIRAMEGALRNVPIVAVTANAMKGDREKCLEAGMNDYLSKPVSRSALAKMLEKWLLLPDTTGALQCTDSGSKAPIPEEETTPEGIVWDRSVLLHRLDGDEELTDEIAAEFLEDIPDEFAALAAALASGDLPSAGRHAHTVKGTSASVGGEALRAVAFETEKAAKAQDAEAASAAFRKMEFEFGRLKENMEKGL